MCESYPEQRPLLCDEISDEDFKIQKSSPSCQRRIRTSAYSGRVKGKLKGAAAIITLWPEHLSSLLAYWWAGLGMIAVTIFIIYNYFSIIGDVTPVSAMHISGTPKDKVINNISHTDSKSLSIFMHTFVKEHEEIIPDNYLPYIKIMAKKHLRFKYNLVFVINDIPNIPNDREISEKNNNEIALNSLWAEKNLYDKQSWIENISIQHISLTNYLDESPLKKYWRRLPPQFIEFLVRCVSIWERGGIAFNPIILTPQTPSPIYKEKLQYLLRKYNKHLNHKYKHKELKNNIRPKSKLQVNNIRDIIKAFENEDIEQNIEQFNLTEAENQETKNIKVDKRYAQAIDKHKIKSQNIKDTKIETRQSNDKDITKMLTNGTTFDVTKQSVINPSSNVNNRYNLTNNNSSGDNTTRESLLPLFLKYLFHDEVEKYHLLKNSTTNSLHTNTPFIRSNSQNGSVIKQNQNDFSAITTTTTNYEDSPVEIINFNKPVNNNINEHISELTIDLKGNFIATKFSCHAFIGTIFSNINRYSDRDKVTELIIAELSLFCKGLLSSCQGVDIILL